MTSPFIDRRSNSSQRWLGVAIAAGAVMIGVLFVALIDARLGKDRIARNVSIAGRDVGRMSRGELNDYLSALEGKYRTMQVGIAAPSGGFTVTGADLGVTIDKARLTSQLFQVGHTGGSASRISSYFGSFFNTTTVKIPVDVDPTAVTATLTKYDADERVEPVDPQLLVQDDGFAIKPGKPGTGINGDVIVASLPLLVDSGPISPTITVDRVELPERYSSDQLKALVAKAEDLTARPLKVQVGERSATLTPKQLRTLVTPAIVDGRVRLTLDEAKAMKVLTSTIGKIGTTPRDARLQVNDDGTVSAVPSQVGFVCCEDGSGSMLNDALAKGTGSTVELKLKTVQPKVSTESIVKLGVKEQVATFTTKHAPGEVRVKNIHHISDLVRGYVIQPGDTFSVNDLIGPRTEASGFYKAHVIEDGVYTENFGGGISQFATTMFNAAFFGGLDLVEYQSHSLYIPRYPYGREATLSFPAPDLKIRNNTPYGILIWPTYTARSITVTLYSTKWVSGEVGEQTVQKRNQCKRVYTTRVRTYADGTKKTDRIVANYRPKEGVDCKGNPTAGATTTLPKTSKPKTSKPKTTKSDSSDDSDSGSGDSDTVTSKKKPVEAGGGDDDAPDTKAKTSKPKSTKAPSDDGPPATKAPAPDPKPEPKPEPEPTPPSDDGVAPAAPPVTGLG